MSKITITHEPFDAWPKKTLADARRSSQAQYEHGFQDILTYEGPMQALSLFQTYAKAGGLMKIARPVRRLMERALLQAEKSGAVLIEREDDPEAEDADDCVAWIVRLPDQKRVYVRKLGPRGFADIPLSELAAVVLEIRTADDLMGREDIYRAVLDFYELQKLTALVRRRLDTVLETYF